MGHCFLIATGSRGSVNTHFGGVSKALAERGHRVILVAEPGHLDDFPSPVIGCQWPSPTPHSVGNLLFLSRLIHVNRPDCVLGHFARVNSMLTLGLLQRVPCRIAWYHTMSTYEPSAHVWKRRLRRYGKRLVYRAATHVVGVSNACRDDVIRVYGVPDTKCRVFRNCISDPLTEPRYLDLEKQRGTIVCVGNLRISKGQHVLIRAFALLKEKGVRPIRLVLVGNGPAMAAFRTLARDLGVERDCEFAGHKPRQDVFELLATAAVSVLPSSSEGLPYANIESFAVGTPVVASRVGGIPEIVRDGVDGFLVPAGDPLAIADKLHLLLSDDELRATMGQHARQRFLTAFEERSNIDEQASWLHEIVALTTGRP